MDCKNKSDKTYNMIKAYDDFNIKYVRLTDLSCEKNKDKIISRFIIVDDSENKYV